MINFGVTFLEVSGIVTEYFLSIFLLGRAGISFETSFSPTPLPKET